MPNRCTIFVFSQIKKFISIKTSICPNGSIATSVCKKTASRKVTYSSIRMISTYQTHCRLSVFNIYIYQSTTYGLTHITAIRHRLPAGCGKLTDDDGWSIHLSVYNLLIINGLRIILTDDSKKHYSVIPSVYYAQQLPAKNCSASAKVSSLPTSSRLRPGCTQPLTTALLQTFR